MILSYLKPVQIYHVMIFPKKSVLLVFLCVFFLLYSVAVEQANMLRCRDPHWNWKKIIVREAEYININNGNVSTSGGFTNTVSLLHTCQEAAVLTECCSCAFEELSFCPRHQKWQSDSHGHYQNLCHYTCSEVCNYHASLIYVYRLICVYVRHVAIRCNHCY